MFPILHGIALVLFLGALSAGSALAGGITTRASVDNAGTEGNSGSSGPSISADGRYVAFYSDADNLVPDDSNFVFDVFVRDRRTGTTTRVSVDSAGNQGDDEQFGPSISADGRYVAFDSVATNLVTGDTNGVTTSSCTTGRRGDHAGERGQRREPRETATATVPRSARTGGTWRSRRSPPTW